MNTEIGRLLEAINFAAERHRSQRRKNASQDPYINHPIEVANILSRAGVKDVEVLIAAILHDCLEDTATTLEDISFFGKNVAKIVVECSDDKSLEKVERKKLQIEHAKTISYKAKLVKLADKLSNLRNLEVDPPASWSKEVQYGYFLWSFLVCREMKGICQPIEDQLWNIFEIQGILAKTPEEQQEELEKYYSLI